MKKNIYLSIVCALAINVAASDLGTIQVESSTIDDKFANKATEISSTETMTGTEVEEFHAENIADVLNTLPGVTVRKNEGDSNKIHIRGVATEMYMGEQPGVAIVIDGVPVQERAGAVNIDVDNIESIKVLKGGASYLYGNDALAGAIIITTKRPKNKNQGFVATEQGSYGFEKYVASYNVGTEKFAANIQASYKAADGYWEDSDYYTKSINGKFQYYIDDSSDITLGADKTLRFENDTGSITHSTQSSGVYTNNVETNPTSKGEVGYSTNYDIDLTKLFLTYSKDFENDSNLMAQVYKYEDITKNRTSAFATSGVRGDPRDDHKYDAYANTDQVGLKSEYRLGGQVVAGMLGLDIARNEEDRNTKYRVVDGSHQIGELVSDTSSTEDINAIYGEFKYQIAKDFVATLNARYDQISYDYKNNMNSDNWDKIYNENSYRAGLTYNLAAKQIIFASVSTGFRVPTISQLFAGDISSSSRATYANNSNIDTEKTLNFEIGFRQQTDLISYEVSIFQLDRNDVITRDSGNYAADANTTAFPITYGNYSDIQNRGLELGLNSDRSKDLSFVFNYTYLDSKYTRFNEYKLVLNNTTSTHDLTGNTIPRTSKHTVYLEGNYKIIPSVLLTADVNYRSSQYADELNEVKVDGYAVVNLRAKYNVTLASFDIEMFGKVENVFDEQYYMMPRVTGDRNGDDLYDERDMGLTVNPGRTFLAGLSAKF